MSVLCPTNLTLPWEPLCERHVFLKIPIVALDASILMFSISNLYFTLIEATIYHLGITAH